MFASFIQPLTLPLQKVNINQIPKKVILILVLTLLTIEILYKNLRLIIFKSFIRCDLD